MANVNQFDRYLTDDGVAALVIREYLMPVEGEDGVVFPSTFAEGNGFPGGYNINGEGAESVCLIDTVGSQANRLEPIFSAAPFDALVPQIVVKAGDKEVNLLDAGHRAGDALVRCSELQDVLQKAFHSVLKGDAGPMAKIAPTSLVFGVWDSRDTQAKLPRLMASTIRAFDIQKLTRGAQYNPPLNYAELDVFSEEDKAKAEGDTKNPLAQRGFVHVPATGSHGGVIAKEIRRDATLGLAALRLLHVGKDEDATLKLRRYVLGLGLVAFTQPGGGYLRQGCLLVPRSDKTREFVEVLATGERKPLSLDQKDALAYAQAVAKEFGVGESKTVTFDKDRAKKDVAADGDGKGKKKGKKNETPEGGNG
jgi:CRISPR-associated protein Csb1